MIAEKGVAMVKDAAAKTGRGALGQRCLAAVRLSVSGGDAPECDLQQQCSALSRPRP
jgi:hypothetical protein